MEVGLQSRQQQVTLASQAHKRSSMDLMHDFGCHFVKFLMQDTAVKAVSTVK